MHVYGLCLHLGTARYNARYFAPVSQVEYLGQGIPVLRGTPQMVRVIL